ncbi:hypothetical protein ElyMa_002205200 [Elysia marginata]|uniref:Uncharacterized protein n=1 Tax=Elysia marginata TaxID=1093978 RepID=A0AAV4FRM7_9GAST|nr:hypothetical protein ElyMa_002205200 [Elysia marginata]
MLDCLFHSDKKHCSQKLETPEGRGGGNPLRKLPTREAVLGVAWYRKQYGEDALEEEDDDDDDEEAGQLLKLHPLPPQCHIPYHRNPQYPYVWAPAWLN